MIESEINHQTLSTQKPHNQRKRRRYKSARAVSSNPKLKDIDSAMEHNPSTLYVGAIKGKSKFPDDIKGEDLKKHFSKYGADILKANIVRDHGIPKGYGFVTFSSYEIAESVRKEFHGTHVRGCLIRLDHYKNTNVKSKKPIKGSTRRFSEVSSTGSSFVLDSTSEFSLHPCSPSNGNEENDVPELASTSIMRDDYQSETLLVQGIHSNCPDDIEGHFSGVGKDIASADIVEDPLTQRSLDCRLHVVHTKSGSSSVFEQPPVYSKGMVEPMPTQSEVFPNKLIQKSKVAPFTSKRCGSTIVVDNIPEHFTVDDIKTITDCPGTHVTIEVDQERHAVLVLPKDVDTYSVCCKWDGKILLGEPIHAYIVHDEQDQPSEVHQIDDLNVKDRSSSKHRRQRMGRKKKLVKPCHGVETNLQQQDDEYTGCEIPQADPSDSLRCSSTKRDEQSSTPLIQHELGPLKDVNHDGNEQAVQEHFMSSSLPPSRNEHDKSTSAVDLAECDAQIVSDVRSGFLSEHVQLDSKDSSYEHRQCHLTNSDVASVNNSPVFLSSPVPRLSVKQKRVSTLTKEVSPHTKVVFFVNCKTSKSEFSKFVHHHLENVTAEFEVVDVKQNPNEMTSEVMVQFPSLDIANLTLMQLQQHSDLNGKICEPEKSSTGILFNKKIVEFKESIQVKCQLYLAKHQNKMDNLKKEHKKLTLPCNCPINLFQDITVKRSVLNQAIVECERQQTEFNTYCTCLHDKLSMLQGEVDKLSAEIAEGKLSETFLIDRLSTLRKMFGLECNRLERALPMYAYRSEIIEITQSHGNQVIILIGETGSGKSTQIVQYIYECGLVEKGIVVCTQPRKVAAISLAKHVSTEMGVALGQALGYKTGLRSHCSDKTKVVYMTDHTLLNESIADPAFSKYSCLIVDEAHERSLSTDLLLAFIKKCLPRRPDLKVIITSATIDPKIFNNYFGGGCPIIKVPGRTYPVDVVWNPLKSDKSPLERNYVSDAVKVACQLHEDEPAGDILVFLTSAAEIEKACQSTLGIVGSTAIVLPLHGKLPPEEQQKVFHHDDQRKIVFATNVAETSVTIPGVKYIVDTGLAKELCFDPKKNMNSLEVQIISKSSAEQRKGRAGRTSAGKCYRLYSEEVFDTMPDKSLPEILRVTLESTALKLHEFGVADVLHFDFVEEPDRAALEKAVENLVFLEAIRDGHLTEIGKKMAALPIDPHLSRIVLDGIAWGVGLEATVSGAISTLAGSVFFRAGTDEMKLDSDMKTITFCHPAGDQMTYLHTYFQWAAQERADQNQWCVEHFVNAKSMRMVREVVREFRDILRIKFDILLEDRPINLEIAEEVLPKLYFDTFIRNICIFLGHERMGYLNNNLPSERLFIFHGSPLRQLNVVPKFLVYEKTLVTTQHFLLQALRVKEEWIYEAIESGKLPCHPSETSLYKQLCVVPVTVSNLGKYALKQLQKQWQKNSKSVVEPMDQEVDYDYKQGTMKVFVPTIYKKATSEVLLADVSRIRSELKHEVCEKGATKDDDNVRVVLKDGATIKYLLMPDQYRTVVIKGPSVGALKDEILQALENFGAMERVNSKEFNGEHQLYVTFLDPDNACEAVRSLGNEIHLLSDVVVQPYTPYRRPQDNISTFILHIEWCRRVRKQHAFVNFENEEDFSIAVQRFCTPGRWEHRYSTALQSMKFRPSKDGATQLFVTSVNLFVTEGQIKEAIHAYLPEVSKDKFEVKIGYEKSFETTSKELRELKEELDRLIAPHATNGKYKIIMNPPKNFFKTYKALIKFDSPDEGYATLKHIQHACIAGKELSVKSELSSTVRYSSKVYSAVEKSIQEVTNEINHRYKSVRVNHGQQDDKGRIVVRISAEDVNTFIIAKHALSTVILPDVIDCHNPGIREFIHTANCRKGLERIEKETSTFIRLDVNRATLSIYGNESNRTRAKIEFNKCLSFLDDGTKCFEIRLKEGKPPGLMKHLISQFGPGLQQLEEREGVTTIRLDPRRQLVTMFGTQGVYDFLVDKIDEFIKSIDPNLLSSVHHHTSDEIECCVCFVVISNPSEIFRLEFCGHTYCIDCIKTQVAPSTVEFPVLCAADGCSESIVWRDLYSLSELTGFSIRHMVNASVRSYVAANQDKVRNCPTPDCSMIYNVTTDGKCFFCQLCGAIVCTTCHEPYHEGVTCAMYQSGKAADIEFEDWLRHDPDNRKRCPRCSAPIEKTFGCNHVACTQCKVHICWFCLDYFWSDIECYDHMSERHRGFGIN